MNEKTVNELWLLLTHTPVDSIDSNYIFLIQTLASSCPFIEGPAVYRARSLWSLWEPAAVFDDRIICLAAANKSTEPITDIEQLIQPMLVKPLQQQLQGNDIGSLLAKGSAIGHPYFNIYPNPTSGQVTVSYDCKSGGTFILNNVLGQEILKSDLKAGKMKVTLLVSGIAPGVYSYRCHLEDCDSYTGLLLIQNQ